jgi:hypothetical protein
MRTIGRAICWARRYHPALSFSHPVVPGGTASIPKRGHRNLFSPVFVIGAIAESKRQAFKLRQNIYDMVAEFNQAGLARKQQFSYLKSRGVDIKEFYERYKG